MILPEKKQLPRREIAQKPAPPGGSKKIPAPQKDTSIFRGRPYLPMNEVSWKLRRASPSVPGFPTLFSERERIEMGQELGKRFGSYLKKSALPKLLRDLEMEKSKAQSIAEKMKTERKIRFFKRELMGQ